MRRNGRSNSMSIAKAPQSGFEFSYPVIVIGGGGTGLSAALAAKDGGAEVLILERDKSLLGTTAMSTGLIPASGTKDQKELGIDDSPERFVSDIMGKTKGRTSEQAAMTLATESIDTVNWLRDSHNINLNLIDDFLYPGHTAMRMYGMPHRSGAELMGALMDAAGAAEIDILTEARATQLYVSDKNNVTGVRIERPNGDTEDIGCDNLILACCGFAGDETLVEKYIPEIKNAVFHGHPGNKGEAIIWGESLGAELADMSAYQGHAGLAVGHGIPILWPSIMQGGFQVNLKGVRFSNESQGYSEQAVKVLAQDDGIAWSIFDLRCHELMTMFDDYQDALKAQAIIEANSIEILAAETNLPLEPLQQTVHDVANFTRGKEACPFGRDFTGKPPLKPPYYAARVTGALFHTQGGLVVNEKAQVIRKDGTAFTNLFAGGGAARGISGPSADGYLAGNGLLTATTYGKLAGRTAAENVRQKNG